jgi:hypothetical protein
LDDVTRLDTARKIVAVAVLLIFVLTFTPLPMRLVAGEMQEVAPARSIGCLAAPGLIAGAAAWIAGRVRARRIALKGAHLGSKEEK